MWPFVYPAWRGPWASFIWIIIFPTGDKGTLPISLSKMVMLSTHSDTDDDENLETSGAKWLFTSVTTLPRSKRWDQKLNIFTVCWFLYAIAFKSDLLRTGLGHGWACAGGQSMIRHFDENTFWKCLMFFMIYYFMMYTVLARNNIIIFTPLGQGSRSQRSYICATEIFFCFL